MKRFFLPLLLAALFVLSAGAQSPTYRVHIGTFVNARLEDYQRLRPLGFVYGKEQQANYFNVLLSGGLSAEKANQLAQRARGYGYLSARAEMESPAGNPVYVVQFASVSAMATIDWEKYLPLGDLYFMVQDQVVRLGVGTFPDANAAKAQIGKIREAGYSDAFIKQVDRGLIHELGRFELAGVKRPLIPLSLDQQPAERPASPGNTVGKGTPATPPGTLPAIRADVRRNSVYELQKVLKEENAYSGSLDGYYGPATGAAYESFIQENRAMQQYLILARNLDYTIETGPQDEIQAAINNLVNDPARSISTLQIANIPVALAYRAYYQLISQGPSPQVNQLMNEAIRKSYAANVASRQAPLDIRATYSYPDLTQLLTHLQYIHAAPGNEYVAPCWLFSRHPQEINSARLGFSDFADDSYALESCDPFTDWEEIRIMIAVAEDLGGRQANDDPATLIRNASRRTKLYFLEGPLVNQQVRQQALQWYDNLLAGLNAWAGRDPLHQKLLLAFETAFYQSQVRLEDFYMNKGYSQQEARFLAIATLNTLVSYQLERFV